MQVMVGTDENILQVTRRQDYAQTSWGELAKNVKTSFDSLSLPTTKLRYPNF